MQNMSEKVKLFCGRNYYPLGGWDDFKGYFESIETAKSWVLVNEPDADCMWAHIVFEDKIVLYASCHPEYERSNEWVWRDEE